MKRIKLSILFLVVVALISASATVSASIQPQTTSQANQQFGSVYIKSHRVTVTIDNQVAVTKVEQVFVNEGGGPAEGTYLFPLPVGAAVSNLVMYINGQPIQGKILDAQQAQQIYTETVRRLRDPALLQYVGRSAIQANVFPIPAGEERKLEFTYSQIISADSGLINYTYPLKTDYASPLPVREVSVSLKATSKAAISTVYSPNSQVITTKTDDNNFTAGFEAVGYRAVDDFSVYYGVASSDINANLLTYRGSADEDGYFMLMITPPTKVDASRVIPKDVLIVLDQSGSMQGAKWDQARAAVGYVLKNLNPEDRFNAVVFSTGTRIYAKSLQPVSKAEEAANWINGLEAIGGTNISDALADAIKMIDPKRQTVVLFLTDGLPTEGVTDVKQIIANVQASSVPNLRIFSFGVGDDVDTFLLDTLSSTHRGVSVYVRPNENIEQKVSALYNKITSPVLTALKVDYGEMILEDTYPSAPLPDLFAGSQLVVVGRFRAGGKTTVTVTGEVDGKTQTYTYKELEFSENSGGQPFIARLWASRKIGALLNQIRLNGETKELVDSVVRLSVRYGIITPYTSYLIEENDIYAQGGGEGCPTCAVGGDNAGAPVPVLPQDKDLDDGTFAGGTGGGVGNAPSSGSAAVDAAEKSNELASADQVAAAPTIVARTDGSTTSSVDPNAPPPVEEPQGKVTGTGRANEPIKQVNDRTFVLQNGIWKDTLYTDDAEKPIEIKFLSDEYFKLLTDHPEIKDYLAIGDNVIIVIGDTVYHIKPE